MVYAGASSESLKGRSRGKVSEIVRRYTYVERGRNVNYIFVRIDVLQGCALAGVEM